MVAVSEAAAAEAAAGSRGDERGGRADQGAEGRGGGPGARSQ